MYKRTRSFLPLMDRIFRVVRWRGQHILTHYESLPNRIWWIEFSEIRRIK